MTKAELKPKDFASLRDIAERLGSVVEGLAVEPMEALPAARQLLDDLKTLLPKRSIAELVDTEFQASIGLLAEISGHANLAMIIGRGRYDGQVKMMWTSEFRISDHPMENVFPRWDLPPIIPAEGIPLDVDRMTFERPVIIDTKQAQDAEPIDAEWDEPEPQPEKITTAPKPPAEKYAEATDAAPKEEPAEDYFRPLTYEEFCALPNRSIVTTDVKSTGGTLEGVRTRKGRWRMSDMPDSCSDKEAWEEFTDSAAGNPINLVVGSHES
ncbi:hypothetical protein [Corynebacterium sp.]|uniref:hypothetical protein n=1 Tax=Corynebacterium sp. TaxID=1720 RepID=UPI0028AD1835|nr:hypothetical protein [Corynebacterium sp.]